MTRQRVLLTLSTDHAVDWEIEIERNGRWLPTVYAGSTPSIDDAFVAAKRYLEAMIEAANGH